MFKFGFLDDKLEKCEDENKGQVTWIESKEEFPFPEETICDIIKNSEIIDTKYDNIKYLSPSDAIEAVTRTENSLIISAETNHSDLLKGKYEGGLKVWECTFDLLEYLTNSQIDFQSKKILDLGCGTGILGIWSLKRGSSCFFQDYNTEVLQYSTIPNVKLNFDTIENCKFYSGDWKSFSDKLDTENVKFDYILTSETIYNEDNYGKLVNVFRNLLNAEGTIFLSAKSYYFGVGGSISSFTDFLSKDELFEWKICWGSTNGLKREILEIKFKK